MLNIGVQPGVAVLQNPLICRFRQSTGFTLLCGEQHQIGLKQMGARFVSGGLIFDREVAQENRASNLLRPGSPK